MSTDMSMFKKMKERITDEVSSATSKLQNMQIIDQLSSKQGQLINDMVQNQLLPEHHGSIMNSTQHLPVTNQFSLIDVSSDGGLNEDEELNSETSPQHKLFDEHSIRRLNHANDTDPMKAHNDQSVFAEQTSASAKTNPSKDLDNIDSVIKINEINSDLEDECQDGGEGSKENDGSEIEIDLLSHKSHLESVVSVEQFSHYKNKYRAVVHAIRKLTSDSLNERAKFKLENNQLLEQIATLKTELDNSKQQHDSLLSISTSASEKDDKSSYGSPQPTSKSGQKLKDLERLLAKCKESLKVKNSQIQALKDSLSEVDKFKESNQDLRRELAELRDAHETWTVSIAENKRVMHQELENKNSAMELVRQENNDLRARLNDNNNKARQLKSTIQDLESRLVRTSAAHQKERESLTKELTSVKNNAIRQIQKEHEHNIERIKLDFEKSIEVLKLEIFNKDELIVTNAKQLQDLNDKISSLTQESAELAKQLEDIKTSNHTKDICERCIELENKLKEESSPCNGCENYQQQLHEINTQLNLLTNANEDQEKEIKHKESERSLLFEENKTLKFELEDLMKKNESLARDLTENEIEMKTQQSQINQSTVMREELEALKKANASLDQIIEQIKAELNEKCDELERSKVSVDNLTSRIAEMEREVKLAKSDAKVSIDETKEIIIKSQRREKRDQELRDAIALQMLAAIKNLETPDTSPGSDKSLESGHQDSKAESGDKKIPDLWDLLEELKSQALNRSQDYMTATQKLQAVVIENTAMADELKRLKLELNNLNEEKAMETQSSVENTERLLSENQALIHDQKTYEEKIRSLEQEVWQKSNEPRFYTSGSDHTYQLKALQRVLQQYQEENKQLQEIQKNLQAQLEKDSNSTEIPDSTQFEYLKNIVYQFMLGKEPLVLARVISAVFKFDKSQIDQICRKQEAVQQALKQST